MKKRPTMRMIHWARSRIIVFTDKYPHLGPLFWILAVQYMIVQVVVASAWINGYDWKNNFISDLGNTVCGTYGGLYVCSPLHALMNLSFIIFGLTMAIGSVLIYTEFERTKLSLAAFLMMSFAGLGTILVGLFPENTIGQLHMLGAFLGLGVGNMSIVILSVALKRVHSLFRIYSLLSGLISIVALVLFLLHVYGDLGRGGMERLVSYPFAIWMILFGLYMSAVRIKARRAGTKT